MSKTLPVIQQVALGSTGSIFSVFFAGRKTYTSLLIYIISGTLIFGVTFSLLLHYEPQIKAELLNYLLPKSWHGISEYLMDFFFESQTKIVLAGLIINGSLVATSICLFPIKERVSSAFAQEHPSGSNNRPPNELPLIKQGLEEAKLLFIYITAQSLILAIGYYPYAWNSILSNTLSILFLCFSFGLDLIAPTLQRQGCKYSLILKSLIRHPILTFLFGSIFTLPLVFLGQYILSLSSLSLAETSAILFGINLLLIAAAIPAGTKIACKLLNQTQKTPAPTTRVKLKVYSILSTILLVSGGFHYLVAMSMHHKSQILKCEYSVDWDSMKTSWPSMSELLNGNKEATLTVKLRIHNPTPYNLEIEHSELNVYQNEKMVSKTKINELSVESGATVVHTLELSTQFDKTSLSNFMNLLNGWTVQLKLELLPGIPFWVKII